MKYTSNEFKNNEIIDFLVKDQYRFLRHTVFLVVFFVLLYFSNFWKFYIGFYKFYVLLTVFITIITMAYINMYFLVPQFFFKNKYILYSVCLICLVFLGLNMISFALDFFFSDYIIEKFEYDKARSLYEGIMMCLPIILITTTAKLLQKWSKDNKTITELSNLTLQMELNELRNQINPHFLFNMLNNVKALIRTDPEKASTVIIKLSEFLRKQLYENNDEKTLLTSEIEFLSNFINLEKIRRENFSIDIKSETDKRILNSTFIPPNLFTTFVENAIKHSADISEKESYVKIEIKIEDQQLYFNCINSQNQNLIISDETYSGLGLANIKRRLELLYGKTYTPKTFSTEKEFIINLIIPV